LPILASLLNPSFPAHFQISMVETTNSYSESVKSWQENIFTDIIKRPLEGKYLVFLIEK